MSRKCNKKYILRVYIHGAPAAYVRGNETIRRRRLGVWVWEWTITCTTTIRPPGTAVQQYVPLQQCVQLQQFLQQQFQESTCSHHGISTNTKDGENKGNLAQNCESEIHLYVGNAEQRTAKVNITWRRIARITMQLIQRNTTQDLQI